ncbi:rhodanese-like domain-containing protein [Youngiibacter fragilis]|uniref:Sulfurtransferase n=1 Tax=Youngiibacter fragilis 232.1 TaxID=994573 RepID=V7I8H2_9CLOT|nr:rhodanese-like domain-containing protein [Youngiibacter fragilis]ETA82143.1 sulfurtransferase [Youngiibacter fragilis 232.1]
MEELILEYFRQMHDNRYKIDQVDFIEKVKASEEMTIIDIRRPEDYEKGNIIGAINMPFGPAIAEGLKRIPEGKPVFVYCYSGQTAGQAVLTMNIAGIYARSVNLGWDLGIGRVEGYEELVTTEPTCLSESVRTIDPMVQAEVTKYYEGLSEVSDTPFRNYKISEEEVLSIAERKDEDFIILSVRRAVDFRSEHIEGAVNIPFGNETADGFGILPKDKKIIVYCYTGQTSGQVTAGLRLLGYDAVSMNAGMGTKGNYPFGWMNKGYPVAR